MNEKIFTKKEINAYQEADADLEKRYQEGDLKGKWALYYKSKETLYETMEAISIMRERKYYTDLLDAFTIAVGSKMTKRIKFSMIYTMRDKEEYCALFTQYNSPVARRALHTLLKSLVDDLDPTSTRKIKGIPHSVSFTGFSKIMLGTGKEFTKESKAYGAGLFNTDYLWYNDDGSTFRWKTEEVRGLCEMILTSREAKTYASVLDLTSDIHDIIYNEPDFIEFITKINDDIEVVERKENKKKDVAYAALFAATKNVRNTEQINLMLKELEARGLGQEPTHNPHVRQSKSRVAKEFKEGDLILKSHIIDLKPLLPILINMPFTKRDHGVGDKPANAKIVVFAIKAGDIYYGFYHEDSTVKVPSLDWLNQSFLIGSTYLGKVDKNIQRKRCDIKFSILPKQEQGVLKMRGFPLFF